MSHRPIPIVLSVAVLDRAQHLAKLLADDEDVALFGTPTRTTSIQLALHIGIRYLAQVKDDEDAGRQEEDPGADDIRAAANVDWSRERPGWVRTAVRLPVFLIRQADVLAKRINASPDWSAAGRCTRSSVLRMALAHGISELELKYIPDGQRRSPITLWALAPGLRDIWKRLPNASAYQPLPDEEPAFRAAGTDGPDEENQS